MGDVEVIGASSVAVVAVSRLHRSAERIKVGAGRVADGVAGDFYKGDMPWRTTMRRLPLT